jgi:hypothetical protein
MIPDDTKELLRLVDGPAVWYAVDLCADETWIWRPNAEDLLEINAALKSAHQCGKIMPTLCCEDFPLPTLRPRLAAAARDLDIGQGVLLIKG